MKKLFVFLLLMPAAITGAQIENIDFTPFVPKDYKLDGVAFGDLDHDSISDCVLVVTGIDTTKIVVDELHGTKVNNNRSSLIVLFSRNGHYERALEKRDFLPAAGSGLAADYAQVMSAEIRNGNLRLYHSFGRSGYCTLLFRYHRGMFCLVSYGASHNDGKIVLSRTSINFLTGQKYENVNVGNDDGKVVWEKKERAIPKTDLLRLEALTTYEEALRYCTSQ